MIKRIRLAIGISNPTPSIIESLKLGSNNVDLTIVGASLDGFNCNTSQTPEAELVTLLKGGSVDGIIRGQLDALKLRDQVCSELGYTKEDLYELGVIEDKEGRVFSMVPCVNSQGWTVESKQALIMESIKLHTKLNLPCKVALLTSVRPGSRGRNEMLDVTWDQAEKLVAWCVSLEIDAKNYNIELEKALDEGCTIVVMQNGMVGNAVLRALLFAGGAQAVGFTLSPMREVVVESLRNEKNFLNYILFAAALVNSREKSQV